MLLKLSVTHLISNFRFMTPSETTKWVRLGDYIEQCDERAGSNYTVDDIIGISTDKKFIDTKANMSGVSLNSYKVVKPLEFAYVADTSRRGDKIALALNDSDKPVLVSSIYTAFRCKDTNKLLPKYLFMLLNRTEFDRYARFNSWGSARETFDWSELCRVQIPLPSPEVQQELVDTYNGIKAIAEQNESLSDVLNNLCQAKLNKLANSTKMIELSGHIEQTNIANSNVGLPKSHVMGMTITKEVIPTKANISDTDISKFKVVYPNEFIYNPRTHGKKIGLGMNRTKHPFLISWNNISFRNTAISVFIPEYLYLWFSRREWDREACFRSWGSSTEVFAWNEFISMKVPCPSKDIQASLCELYNCAERAKKIASEARERLKTLCPALVQRAANS